MENDLSSPPSTYNSSEICLLPREEHYGNGILFFFLSITCLKFYQKQHQLKEKHKNFDQLPSINLIPTSNKVIPTNNNSAGNNNNTSLNNNNNCNSPHSFPISPPSLKRRPSHFELYTSLFDIFMKLEKRISLDEGGRGIKDILLPEGELLHAAVDIFHANHVAILTGFPCLLDYTPPTETDGPLGALALAKALLLLGKKVELLTDECNEEVLLACAAASNLHAYGAAENFRFQAFPAVFTEKDEMRFSEIYNSIDLVISIERAGPNHEQRYLTMRKRDMTNIVAPLEYLTLETAPGGTSFIMRHDIKSIGIGDGGNEVGMGKVYDRIVASKIPNGKEIACVVSANHLIIASVSNWGGYALAAAIGLITLKQSLPQQIQEQSSSSSASSTASSTSSVTAAASIYSNITHNIQDYKSFMVRRDIVNETIARFLPTNREEINKCTRIISAGARDGMTGQLAMMVDGMELEKSLELLDEFRTMANLED